MKAPERLQHRSDLAGRLVRAGKAERTPETTRQRVLATAAALTISTTASKVAATALGALFRGATVRWIATGALLVGGGVTTIVVKKASDHAPATTVTVAAPSVVAAPAVTATPKSTPAEPPVTDTAEAPEAPNEAPATKPTEPARPAVRAAASAPSARPEPPPAVTASAAAVPEPSTLGREVAMLDAARRAIDGDPSSALGVLDRYETTFAGKGHLADEATVLRIKALARRGDRATARALLDAFARRRPNSPHLANLRALVDG